MEKLLLLIGKGQRELIKKGGAEGEYRKTTYFFSGNEEQTCTTPFTGEAIVRLQPGRFGEVHIFGTPDAMWDVLYYHCQDAVFGKLSGEMENYYLALHDNIHNHRLHPGIDNLPFVAEAFSLLTGTPARCHVIPVCTSPDKLWDIFRMMALPELELEGHGISIDITQSLRYHPLFLLFAVRYYTTLSSFTDFQSVFYGAFELQSRFGHRAPIFDITPIPEIMRWIDAANSFSQYGDSIPLSRLLKAENASSDMVDKLQRFSNVIQLNLSEEILQSSKQLIGALRRSVDVEQPAFQMLRPALEKFPKSLSEQKESWEAMLHIAQRHYDNGFLGLSVMAAWEAVISRLAELYGVEKRVLKNYQKLSNLAVSKAFKISDPYPHPFVKHVKTLRAFRNAIAHSGNINYNALAQKFPVILGQLKKKLGDPALNDLPRQLPLPGSDGRN